MQYDQFEYVSPHIFFIDVRVVTVVLVTLAVLLSVLGLASWSRSKRATLTLMGGALLSLMCLIALALYSLAQPTREIQFSQWVERTVEQLNEHYSTEFTREEFLLLSDFPQTHEGVTVYGPLMNAQDEDSSSGFSSYVLALQEDQLVLYSLVGAEFRELTAAQ